MTVSTLNLTNRHDSPLYISIEPEPQCYEIVSREKLTIAYASPTADTTEFSFTNADNVTIWLDDRVEEFTVLIDGKDATDRNWRFEHA